MIPNGGADYRYPAGTSIVSRLSTEPPGERSRERGTRTIAAIGVSSRFV
jgi:hypothetical protein